MSKLQMYYPFLYDFGHMQNPPFYNAVFACLFGIPDKITFDISKDMAHK